jgi:hypothetical protein
VIGRNGGAAETGFDAETDRLRLRREDEGDQERGEKKIFHETRHFGRASFEKEPRQGIASAMRLRSASAAM